MEVVNFWKKNKKEDLVSHVDVFQTTKRDVFQTMKQESERAIALHQYRKIMRKTKDHIQTQEGKKKFLFKLQPTTLW